jgi:hypothetical protein
MVAAGPVKTRLATGHVQHVAVALVGVEPRDVIRVLMVEPLGHADMHARRAPRRNIDRLQRVRDLVAFAYLTGCSPVSRGSVALGYIGGSPDWSLLAPSPQREQLAADLHVGTTGVPSDL